MNRKRADSHRPIVGREEMARMIFVNLPVADVAKSTAFYESIGCVKDPRFSNEVASAMTWSDTISFMILHTSFFSTFTPKQIADAQATTEVLIALSLDSRGEVDAIVEKAGANGGAADVRPVQDMGFMYSRAFADPDGHMFEPLHMDEGAAVAALSATHGENAAV
jgi:predicted lactoylglutathione lyase